MNTKLTLSAMHSTIVTACTSLVALSLLTGCHQEPAANAPSGVLAEVNGQPITEAAFKYQWLQRHTGADTTQAREAMLDQLIQRSILVQQARAAGLDADPVVVEQVENLLMHRLEELQLQPKLAAVEISPEEVEAYYQQNREAKFTRPEQRHLAVLWFNTRGQAPLAARYRPRLEQARDAVLSQPDAYPAEQGFGALSIHNSEHRPSQYKGGDLGWLEPSDVPGFVSEVLQIGQQLSRPGEVSPVVESGDGLYVVRLLDLRPGGPVSFTSVAPEIRHKLRREKQQAVEVAFRQRIEQAATIVRHPDHLSALEGLETSPTLTVAGSSDPSALATPEARASQPIH